MQKLGDYYNYDFLKLLNDSLEHVKAFFYWHIKLVLQYIYYSTYHNRNSFRNKFWILILICKNDVNLVAIITCYSFFFRKITYNKLTADVSSRVNYFCQHEFLFFFGWIQYVVVTSLCTRRPNHWSKRSCLDTLDFNKANKKKESSWHNMWSK